MQGSRKTGWFHAQFFHYNVGKPSGNKRTHLSRSGVCNAIPTHHSFALTCAQPSVQYAILKLWTFLYQYHAEQALSVSVVHIFTQAFSSPPCRSGRSSSESCNRKHSVRDVPWEDNLCVLGGGEGGEGGTSSYDAHRHLNNKK